MAEIEGRQDLPTGQTTGHFGDDYPDYVWTLSVTQPPGSGSLRKVEVTVVHNYYPKRPCKLVLYRPANLNTGRQEDRK